MPDEIVAEVLKAGAEISPMREKVLDAQWKDFVEERRRASSGQIERGRPRI